MQIPFNPSRAPPAGLARRLRRQLGFANLAPDILASLQSYLADSSPFDGSEDDNSAGGTGLAKRIVMNPPQSFLDTSAAQGLGGGHHLSGPINIGPGGQISIPNQDAENSAANGQNLVMAPGAGTTGYPVVRPSMTDDDFASALMTSSSTDDLSTSAITSASTATPSSSPTSSLSAFSSSSSAPTASKASSTASLSASSTSASVSSSRSILLPSITSTPSATSSPHVQKDFTHSTLFIVLMVLSSLVIFGIIATSLSWCLRWKGKDGRTAYFGGPACCGRRRGPDPEDDIDVFDRLYAPGAHGSDGMSEVRVSRGEQRSSLQDLVDFGFPRMPAATAPPLGAGFEHGSPTIVAPSPAVLEIRNAFPEDPEKGQDIEPPNTPRYLGVDRNISMSWRRSGTGDSLPSPFLDPVSTHLANNPSRAISDLERSATQDTLPSHAGSWASNLRNTLFAAISTGQGHPRSFSPGPAIDEDKFTRSVLPIHRRLSGLSASSGVSREGRHWATYNGRGLQVLEEKDDYNLPESDAEAIQNSWMQRLSRASSGSSWTPSPRKPRMPLRGAVSPGLYETTRPESWAPGGFSGTTRW